MSSAANSKTMIKILPDFLINQIAAGEVVERPASVVKELLDNSLDAGASQITLDIEQGGVGLIRIKDDGVGIPPDELALALTRHATSKINAIDDLREIMTMGFRGEALPSIASISRLSLTSKAQDHTHAWLIKSEGRTDQSAPVPASHPQGTSIEVRDLFFNVPARRKYLRAERTEFYQIQQLVRHFAVSHPEVGIRLSHNGRQILNLKKSAQDSQERVLAVLGNRFMQHALPIEVQIDNLRLSGWAGNAQAARTMNDSQFFSLNGRCLKDKRINHAIKQAYHGVLAEGRYASFALSLELDPNLVDINVHPAKTEVRFQDSRKVHDFIYGALHRALHQQQASLLEAETPLKLNTATVAEVWPKKSTQVKRSNSPVQNRVQPEQPQYKVVLERARSTTANKAVNEKPASYPISEPVKPTKLKSHTERWINVGQLQVYEDHGELVLLDIKRFHEVRCREQLTRGLAEGSLQSKPLLFPQTIDLTVEESIVLEKNLDKLSQISIDLQLIEQQLEVRSLPAGCSVATFMSQLPELLSLLEHEEVDQQTQLISLLTSIYVDKKMREGVERPTESITELISLGVARKLSASELMKLFNDGVK